MNNVEIMLKEVEGESVKVYYPDGETEEFAVEKIDGGVRVRLRQLSQNLRQFK